MKSLLKLGFTLIATHSFFLLILILSLFFRLYRIDTLTTFGGDQGMDFLTVRDMVLLHKWTLIGLKTSIGPFFQGPLYLYILFPFFLLLHLNPIAGPIAAISISTLSLILLYITVLKFFPKSIAIISTGLFAFAPQFVVFGTTPLYQNFLPLFIIISLYIYFEMINKNNLILAVLLGLSIGFGIELHLLNLTLALAMLISLLFTKEKKIINIILYACGVITGLLPTLIFEVRHNFLNSRLFLDYLKQGNHTPFSFENIGNQWISGAAIFLGGNIGYVGVLLIIISISFFFIKSNDKAVKSLRILVIFTFLFIALLSIRFSAFQAHYILPFWVLSLITIPLMLYKTLPKNIAVICASILLLINFLASFSSLNNNHGYAMPKGWSMKKINQAGEIISHDAKSHQNFNIASLVDGDTRAYPLRYVVETDGEMPENVNAYPTAKYLFVVTYIPYSNLLTYKTWEIASFKPFKFGHKWNLGDSIYLYRLDK